jgi:hypothetical protein
MSITQFQNILTAKTFRYAVQKTPYLYKNPNKGNTADEDVWRNEGKSGRLHNFCLRRRKSVSLTHRLPSRGWKIPQYLLDRQLDRTWDQCDERRIEARTGNQIVVIQSVSLHAVLLADLPWSIKQPLCCVSNSSKFSEYKVHFLGSI